MADLRDLKFFPADERLVKHYLRKRIDTDRENFITDINLYENEPWLLPHVNNDLFFTNEWFYFVKRTCKSGNTPNRTVLGRGGSNGGTWVTNSKKKVILDRNEVVIGYKTELAYYKKVNGKTKGDNTGWLMTEYWPASENDENDELFQEVVLCYIRGKKKNVKHVSSDSSINRVSEPLEKILTMVDPRDLKFFPTDSKLVDHYLRNRVKTEKDGFITDIKLYEDEPWLLSHVNNSQFTEKKWFYFVKRTRGSGNRPKRTVPGRGGSEGGTWTTTGEKRKILDSNNIVIGYKVELSYYKHVKGKKKGDTTGWCMTEYWLASKDDALFQEVVLCNIRVKKNPIEPVQFQTETNNIIEQTPVDNNMVSNALVTGVGEFGQQNMENDEVLDFTHQQQPLRLPQESIPLLQGEDSRSPMDQHMEEYADELENMLDVEEEGDDGRTIQQQHPQPLPLQDHDVRSMDQQMEAYADELENMLDEEEEDDDDKAIQQQLPQIPLSSQCQDSGNPLVIMENEGRDQDIIFNLVDQEGGLTRQQQQKKIFAAEFGELYFAGLEKMRRTHYSQKKYLARDQEMSTRDNMMMTNNHCGFVFDTLGCKMQEPHVTNEVNQDLSCSCATEEQMSKRRKQC